MLWFAEQLANFVLQIFFQSSNVHHDRTTNLVSLVLLVLILFFNVELVQFVNFINDDFR
jgi:hypothetical protein